MVFGSSLRSLIAPSRPSLLARTSSAFLKLASRTRVASSLAAPPVASCATCWTLLDDDPQPATATPARRASAYHLGVLMAQRLRSRRARRNRVGVSVRSQHYFSGW